MALEALRFLAHQPPGRRSPRASPARPTRAARAHSVCPTDGWYDPCSGWGQVSPHGRAARGCLVAQRPAWCVALHAPSEPGMATAAHAETMEAVCAYREIPWVTVRCDHAAASHGDQKGRQESVDATPARGALQRGAGRCPADAAPTRDPVTRRDPAHRGL